MKLIEYYQNTRAESIAESINFYGLINETFDSLKAENQVVKFDLRVDQEIPFCNDKFRIGLVLKNLISNALKYQRVEESFPAIDIKVKVDTENVIILIQDNGQGIQDEYLDKIFTMFFRAKNENENLGNGLGLYIVKEALNKINGTISVKSVYKKGTNFEVVIPNISK